MLQYRFIIIILLGFLFIPGQFSACDINIVPVSEAGYKTGLSEKSIAMVVRGVTPNGIARAVQSNVNVLAAVPLPFFLIHKISVLKNDVL